MANLLWVPGPWGPDLGRYAEDTAPEAPPTSRGKIKSKAKAKPATLTPSADTPPNGSASPDPASGGADA